MKAAPRASTNQGLRAPVSVTAGGDRWERKGVDRLGRRSLGWQQPHAGTKIGKLEAFASGQRVLRMHEETAVLPYQRLLHKTRRKRRGRAAS
mgnify:CR=1 FL=1